MKKNVAGQVARAKLVSAIDGTAITTGTVTVTVTIDDGAPFVGAGTVKHVVNGTWHYLPTQSETNGESISFDFDVANVVPTQVTYETNYPQSTDNNTILATLPTQTYLDSRTLPSANYFDHTTDQVIVSANNDKSGYAITQSFPANFSALSISSTGKINNVGTVDLCTTNSDMRGTNNALLASSYTAPDNTTISSINTKVDDIQGATFDATTDSLEAIRNRGDAAWVTATGFSTFNPSVDQVIVGTNNDKTGYAISGTKTTLDDLNDISVSNILTTQMTESYAANGVAPTLSQALFITMQNLQDFSFTGVTQTVKKLDGSTAATYTLDDATAPTSKTRAT